MIIQNYNKEVNEEVNVEIDEENELIDDEKYIKYTLGENGLLEEESDDENIIVEYLIQLKEEFNPEIVEKVYNFHKYTNRQIDDHLDYARELTHEYFSRKERKIISSLYSKFKKRNTNKIVYQLFKLIKFIQSKDRKKIATYLLFYVISRTLQTLKIKHAISLYIVGYEKILEFKENESLNFEDFFKFDNHELPKLEKVLYNQR